MTLLTPTLSAVDCARVLGQQHVPTAEQVAVIEAPLEPLLVVAGAGSGKTETMAARVVWLVANGFVQPEEVLGLTFTRKAAGELGERLAARLGRLRDVGLWVPATVGGAASLGQLPVVSTYHSYAGRIVREHGTRLGHEADTRLLTEAAAWQFAHEAVVGFDGDIEGVVKVESTVTTALVDLAAELAEHLVSVDQLDEHLGRVISGLDGLVKPEGSKRRGLPAAVKAARTQLAERRSILPLLRDYARLKLSRDAMDFADQMAVAAALAARFPQVGAEERSRFRVVLLDEFQDTSEAQLHLLRSIFAPASGPVAVTAVGDPHQSIYGWRGASSTTLRQFRDDFGAGARTPVLPLSTSWRNDRHILEVANQVAAPLRAQARVPVEPLAARGDAGRGHVAIGCFSTIEAEADAVVEWVVARRSRRPGGTAAILCRKRSQFDPVIAALEAQGVAHEVVGLGGLLHTPEVADLVALLWVVQDPTRGDHLMRLLTGARCRLGVSDLDGLAAWTRVLGRRLAQVQVRRSGDEEPPDRPTVPRDVEEGLSLGVGLVEALDDLPDPQWRGPDGEHLSAPALSRLDALGQLISQLRTRTGSALADLLAEAEVALGLDVEVLSRPGWHPGAARAHLDAFQEVAATFDATSDRPSLGGFLAWLDAAVDEERGLDLGWIETSPDAVQVMTVHAAKGLEWDVVAVPGMVESSFPAHSGTTTKVVPGADGEPRWGHADPTDKAWLGGLAGVPHDLRGDREGLPRFPWDRVTDWDEVDQAFTDYVAASAARGIEEERRLAYVALTRARTDLLLTSHVWGSASTPRLPSRFLTELRAAGMADREISWADLPSASSNPPTPNPRLAHDVAVVWPPEPIAGRARVVEAAAQVRARLDGSPNDLASGPDPSVASTAVSAVVQRWDRDVQLLLAERDRRSRRTEPIVLPQHLSTSDLVALATDPAAYAMALRRPMPSPAATAARVGTTFHAWVEAHYSRAAILDVASLPGAGDEGLEGPALETLQANFLASRWAELDPLELEVPVETTVAGTTIRGRIDAVFADPDHPGGHLIIDWKTGSPSSGAAGRHRAVQLASYVLAWCRLRAVARQDVRAAFFHAATGETVWPELMDEDGLAAILSAVDPA